MADNKQKWYVKLFKPLRDILQENGKTSQGRVYLMISVIAYYLTLGILTFAGLNKKTASDLEMGNFEIIIEALKYAMMLFGGYVFGGKFLSVIEALKGGKIPPIGRPKDDSENV